MATYYLASLCCCGWMETPPLPLPAARILKEFALAEFLGAARAPTGALRPLSPCDFVPPLLGVAERALRASVCRYLPLTCMGLSLFTLAAVWHRYPCHTSCRAPVRQPAEHEIHVEQ